MDRTEILIVGTRLSECTHLAGWLGASATRRVIAPPSPSWIPTLDGEGVVVIGDGIAEARQASLTQGLLAKTPDLLVITCDPGPARRTAEGALQLPDTALGAVPLMIAALTTGAGDQASRPDPGVIRRLMHDLRAPLRHMGLLAEFIADDLPQAVAEDIAQHVDSMRRTSRLALSRLDDFQTYLQLEGVQVENRTVDLDTVFATVAKRLRNPDRFGNPTFDIGKMPPVRGDQILLIELFLQLIENGLTFNEAPQREITISARQEGLLGHQITVRDNGIGIAPGMQHRIFRPFERLWPDTEYTGTGLGLAIADKIARAHGTLIECQSQEGTGSKFSVTLQAA